MKIKIWGTALILLTLSLVCFSNLYADDDRFLGEDKMDQEPAAVTLDSNNRFTLEVWSGYGTVKMSEFNTYIDYENTKFFGGPGESYTYDKPQNAYEVGLDLNYKVTPNLKIGPRVSYVMVSAKNVNRSLIEETWSGNSYYWKYESTDKYEMTLLPILIGGEYFTQYNDLFSYNCKLYLGYGLAKLKETNSYSNESNYSADSNYSDSSWATRTGSDVVVEASLGGDLTLSPRVSLGMDLGYRFAKIKELKLSDSTVGDLGGNLVFKDEFGKRIPLDFSGVIAAIRANFTF